MATSADDLPEELEERLYEVHLDGDPEQRTQRVDGLCREHPEAASALRRLAARLARSDRLLGCVHEELHGRADREHIGPFRLCRVLGEGGFGTVYLAEQEEPVKRLVAVKVLHAGRGDTRSQKRFEDEKQLLARLQHPCIAHVYDAGVTEDRLPYFAMEYVDGVAINLWCERRRASTDERLRLFLQVCGALHHAHQREVVHRDLKPANVLVAEEDGKPAPKVIDFGIAKPLQAGDEFGQELTIQHGQVGTPGYMSPEQAAGLPVDARTDIYSLGVLLCELLTGEQPLPRERLVGTGIATVARVLAESAPSRPSSMLRRRGDPVDRRLMRRLREDLDWIVLKAVATDRESRYSSVAALAEDVERHLQRKPVHARQHASAYVVRKFVLRHRLAAGVIAMVLLSLLGAVASLTWGIRVAERARAAAEGDRDVANQRTRAARMAVAQLALRSGDVQTAAHNLEDIPADYRGWEWRHLAEQLDTSLRKVDIGEDCLDLIWLDERRVMTFPMFGAPTEWDLVDGVERRTLDWRGVFRRVAYDRPSGAAVLVGDEQFGIWDLRAGACKQRLHRTPGEVLSLAWSADCATVAVGGKGRWLDLIDVMGGQRSRQLRLPRDASAAAFVGSDSLLVGCVDGTLLRVAIADGAVETLASAHMDHVTNIVVDADAGRAWTSSLDCTVQVWDVRAGTRIAALPCEVGVRRLLLSPGGERLYACGGYTGSFLTAWHTETHELLGRYSGHEIGVLNMALDATGDRLASCSRDGTLRLWPATPPQPRREVVGHDARTLARSADGARFATASFDGRVTVWDAHSLSKLLELETGKAWSGCALGADTVYAAGAVVQAFDLVTGEPRAVGATNGRQIEGMLTDQAGRWLAGAWVDHVLIWSLPELELRHDLSLPVYAGRLAWDARRGCFAVTGADATVRWLDPASGQVRHERRIADADRPVGALAIAEDLLVTGTEPTILVERDGVRRHELFTFHTCASISPDGKRLVTGGSDHKVRVWDLDTGDQLLVFDEPIYPVASVHFVDDGARVVALSHRWNAPSYLHVWSAPAASTRGR